MNVKHLSTLLLSMYLVCLSPAGVQAAPDSATGLAGSPLERGSAADRKALLAAVDHWKQAVIAKDRSALESIFDADLTYGHTTGEVVDKQGTIQRALDPAQSFSAIDITDLGVRSYGVYALVTHKIAFHVVKDGSTTVASLSGLDVWVKKAHGWHLLARQLTRLPATQPAS